MQHESIRLSTNLELTFGEPSAWDMAEYTSLYGEKLAAESVLRDQAPAPIVNDEEEQGEEKKRSATATETKGTMYLVWCSARAGGSKDGFEDFWRNVPMSEQGAVIEAAMPFLGKDGASG